ncbi:MAG: efflux RND transporter periplasmic adaptor subunit [Verrucomicrobiota bacterium]
MKSLFFLTLILSILGGLGFLAYQSIKPNHAQVLRQKLEGVPVTKSVLADIEEIITTSASVRPILETEVRSEINGRIVTLLVEEGDPVLKDQALIELDRTNLQTRLEEAQRQVESERLRLEREERDFERLKVLREENFANEADFLNAQTDYELAKLQLSIRETRLIEARKDLDRATIRAPHDGVIIDFDLTEGRVINGVNSNSNGTLLLKVADLSRMYLEATVSELEVNELFIGKEASIAFDSLGSTRLTATVSQIAASARTERNRRVFPVRFELDTEGRQVRPGISGEIEILVDSAEDAVAVGISSVFFDKNDQPFVYCKSDQGFRVQNVELGIRDHRYIQVLEGIGAGSEIARNRPREDLLLKEARSSKNEAAPAGDAES